jgi:hypothetical protein
MFNGNFGGFGGTDIGTVRTTVFGLNVSNGTDDTVNINTALNNAYLAGGGVVKGVPGQQYFISSALIIGSNVILDMNGCKVTALATLSGNLVNNLNYSTGRTVMDGVTNAASNSVTSATANFTNADIGKTIWLWESDYQNSILKTTIQSVTNSTTIVLAVSGASVLYSATGLNLSIGTRDSNFKIVGGTWTRPVTVDPGGVAGAGMRFFHADSWVATDLIWIQGATRGYAINPCDSSDFTITNIIYNTQSDGVHLNGPCTNGYINNLTGYTRDDTVSLTPNDWTGYNPVYGNITNITIENIRPYKSDGAAVKILGGNASTKIVGITARNISGYATGVALNAGGLVWIGDDTSSANTTGGLVDNITIENAKGQYKTGQSVIYINGTNVKRVRIKRLYEDNANVQINALVWQPAGTIEYLQVDDVFVGTFNTANTVDIVRCDGTIKTCIINNITGKPVKVGYAFSCGAINSSVQRLIVNNITFETSSAGGFSGVCRAANTGSSIVKAQISNINIPDTIATWSIGDFIGTTEFQLSNINVKPNVAITNNRSTSVLTFSGSAINFGGANFNLTAGYQVNLKSFDFPIDLSTITAATKAAGHAAYNTNAVLPCGVGQVGWNGTNWKQVITGLTY